MLRPIGLPRSLLVAAAVLTVALQGTGRIWMLRAVAVGLLITVVAAPAHAQTPPGAPNSPERFAYCEAARSTCLQGASQCPSSPEPTVCTEDVETACSKNFDMCLQAGTEASTPVDTVAPYKCSSIIRRLSNQLRNPAQWIPVVWTTNYFANGVRYAGHTGLVLRRQGADLVGQGQRGRVFYEGSGATVENVSLRIRAGRIFLSEIYGPYEPLCWGDRFMILHTGDSVESLHFKFSQ